MKDSKKSLLEQIEQALESAYLKYGEPKALSLKNLTPEQAKKDLATWGLVVIKDPIKKDKWDVYKQLLAVELSEHLFQIPDPMKNKEYKEEFKLMKATYPTTNMGTLMLKSFAKWWSPKYGFGNSNFRFLFFQAENEPISFKIGDNDIFFSRNPIHRWNLRLLASEPKLWEILKSFHPPNKAMISWDSTKVRINHKDATKPQLTQRHRDVYNYEGKAIDRKQAMLIQQEEGAISLGWVIFSHLPKIQKLISKYLDKTPDKFSIVEDPDLNKILDKYWRSTEGGFVIWEQQTIHYEGQPTELSNYFAKLKSFSQPKDTNYLISIRAVVGSHQPFNLSDEELEKLAFLSEKGLCPAIYDNPNKNTNISVNTVNKKSTRWKQKRDQGAVELEELKLAREKFEDAPLSDKKIYREMYGIY